ncbi:MAG: hypothetical protein A3G34_05135 [Candidatus Lindowbacteria bacterium RIFCSPLOWO2_12_FULL_62_27]|nr:MAG: hypothetical protein A3I06_07450 [Candidatus Lindowbacteria bacterium RIFCSPLOWO2_02_FULL_62_12]OGH61371.1 MAG: hypothetical protein A3G34_05135 [Candidatus Lindowbacteria bacterium RIFCSPLOWO2_12_FULL_62_27]
MTKTRAAALIAVFLAGAAPAMADAMSALKASILSINHAWRFRPDPHDTGLRDEWFRTDFDDSRWSMIDAGKTWESQGFPEYDGVGWYRKRIDIPADWKGTIVRLAASGVDDEYDVYVNGTFVRHHGEKPDRSVWNWQTYTRLDPHLEFGKANTLAIRVNDWGGGGGIWRDIAVRRALPMGPYRDFLPEPMLPAHPEWIDLYWEAWRMAWEKISFGTPENGLAAAYMDEGFNEQIYQWDSVFMCLFARYGLRLFPVMPTLDNFYGKQRENGYIQRCYSESDGREVQTPTPDDPGVNPPLFAWVEWEYYAFTGDRSRLLRVFPKLEKYFLWLEDNARAPEGRGLYYQTDLGSGMDNTPRGDVTRSAWSDMSIQQALAAGYLARMAAVLGDREKEAFWRREHADLKDRINELLWDEADGFYYDLLRSGEKSHVKHIGAFWAMLASVADGQRTARLVDHLKNPAEFYRPHLFPTLAASEKTYAAAGHYWRGSVWAPTNYMVIQGLERRGYGDLAREAAENHVRHMAQVYADPPADEHRIAPEERRDAYRTIWECYSPERPAPATRWDNTFYSRQDFVGWSGLGPIAMLIENILGFEVRGAENILVWTLTRSDTHGIRRLPVGPDNRVSLEASPGRSGRISVRIIAEKEFALEIRRPGAAARRIRVKPGRSTVRL